MVVGQYKFKHKSVSRYSSSSTDGLMRGGLINNLIFLDGDGLTEGGLYRCGQFNDLRYDEVKLLTSPVFLRNQLGYSCYRQ